MASENPPRRGLQGRLVAVASAGQVTGYLLSVLLARRLGINSFEAFVVASAVFIVAAVSAPLGTEKHLLRHLPPLLAGQQWELARGLVAFGVRRTLRTGLLIAILLGLASSWVFRHRPETRMAVIVTCLSLPAGALAHHGVELLTALGRPLLALAVFKLLVPSLALAFTLIMLALPIHMNGPMAVAAWGVAWVIAVAVMAVAVRSSAPAPVRAARRGVERAEWKREARPFLAYRLALALLAQTGVIVLDFLQASPTQVGAYAAAAATVGLLAILATSTNRDYGRRMALLLENEDFGELPRARQRRIAWLTPVLLAFLAVVFAFSRPILSLYGPSFAAEGVTALRLLSLSTAFSILFALAPTYLKFQKRNQTTFLVVASAALGQVLLLVLLVPRFGTSGAALATALATVGMYGTFEFMASRGLKQAQDGA